MTGQTLQHSAEAAAEESERIFSRLIRSIEKQSGEVKELIRLQEKAAVGKVEELLEKIQKEMGDLRRAEGELEKLSGNEDHVQFLQVRRDPAQTAGTGLATLEMYLMSRLGSSTVPHLFLTQSDHFYLCMWWWWGG